VVKRDDRQPLADALVKCEQTVQQLKEENAELRNASQTFGELAERLNKNRPPAARKRKTPIPRSKQR
jgi:hypothetical protein